MIIFLYGQDGYRLKQEAQSIIEKYKNKYPNGMGLFNFDLSGGRLEEIYDAIKTTSFFDEVKLLVIKNCFVSKSNCENICQVIKDYDLENDKTTVLLFLEILSEKEIKSKDLGLFKLLADKQNLVRNFEKLDGLRLENWLKKEFLARNCSISLVAARLLIQLTGGDTNRLIEEVNKLSNYKMNGEIGISDIDNLVSKDINLNIFTLLDVLAAGNKVGALDLLFKELQTGRDPHYILTMMAYQLRNMLLIKDLFDRGLSAGEIAKRSKLHPFVIRKISAYIRDTNENIKNRFSHLAQIDLLIKQGKIDIVDSLYGLIFV